MTQSPETGHWTSMRMPSNSVMTPLRACQPQSGSETTNGVINWNRPATRKNAPINKVKISAVTSGRHTISAPSTPEQDRAQPMLVQAGPFADHDRLDNLNAG